MSGLRKAKKYDWQDSNLALFGSDTEKQVKKASAETEPAWKGAGQKPGVQIWRIVKFKVTHWSKEEYGKFYNGDSYIILNTYKNPGEDELLYDVHFWIGKYSSQDEYGTAAYKTVELDTLLDDKPVQHREVENNESDLFKSYFRTITLLEGGAETGFRHVSPKEYIPRLLHFSGTKKNVIVKEVPPSRKVLDSGDVFIFDKGLQLYQWNGSQCNKDEKFKALQHMQQLKSERGGKAEAETLEEASTDKDHPFYDALGDLEEEEDEVDGNDSDTFKPVIKKLSDASGKLQMTVVSEGKLSKEYLSDDDVFIVDTGKACFVYIGKRASDAENKNGLPYASNYLCGTKHPLVPVTVVKGGKYNAEFEKAIR